MRCSGAVFAALAFAGNLAELGVFKYANFADANFANRSSGRSA